MRKLALICALLMSFSCQAEHEPEPLINRFFGLWEGVGNQDNNSVWNIEISISPTQYLIDYPSLSCGGTLEFIKEIDQSILFREVLTYGTDSCISGGTAALTIDSPNKLLFDWFYPDGSRGAEGNLVRKNK